MENKKTTVQTLDSSENEKHLTALFSILKRRDSIAFSDRKSHFNDTELRLISEVLSAKKENKRLISTRLAAKLGVTRSAISQVVDRLERKGVVKRVPDAVDRKIAYVEITEETLEAYKEDIEAAGRFVGRIVERFGKEKFERMCSLLEEFFDCIKEENVVALGASI